MDHEYHRINPWFLGPKAEHSDTWAAVFESIFQDYIHWRRNYFPDDPQLLDRRLRRASEDWFDELSFQLNRVLNKLKADYPFYSPRYIAHMLSEQSISSVAGYFAGMLYNPNNVSNDAAPITVEMELEVGEMICTMLGFDSSRSWAHICSGGTVANLEALWVARAALFVPLMIRDFCMVEEISYPLCMPNGEKADIRYLSNLELMQIDSNESINLPRNLARFLDEENMNGLSRIYNSFRESPYNVHRYGVSAAFTNAGIRPRICIPESAHYSLKKITNILGLGWDSIIPIPVDAHFRMNIDALESRLNKLAEDEVVMSVIAVMSSTEEGAVDPLDKILQLRERRRADQNRSFWLHADAAWGGYLRTVFVNEEGQFTPIPENGMDQTVQESIRKLGEVESVTVDPHKQGYIPYPCGVVAFGNIRMIELVSQTAHYISDDPDEHLRIQNIKEIRDIGSYIVEGSKPGAAATAAWLAHQTIPLHRNGHGVIVRETLIHARRLYDYLRREQSRVREIPDRSWFLQPLLVPDTNLVIFLAVPQNEDSIDIRIRNRVNREIYNQLSLSKETTSALPLPYMQPFFVSRTLFTTDSYQYDSIASLLTDVNVTRSDYETHGLYVLRSTVMNPWHSLGLEKGMDYIGGFVDHLDMVLSEIEAISSSWK